MQASMMPTIPDAVEILETLQTIGRLTIHGWILIVDGSDVWLTNPHRLDRSYSPFTLTGCESIRQAITQDTHESEWGKL
jgi:hypothetical protein